MTVKEAKAEIVKVLHSLNEDGIHVKAVMVNWAAVTNLEGAKPSSRIECSVELEAQL